MAKKESSESKSEVAEKKRSIKIGKSSTKKTETVRDRVNKVEKQPRVRVKASVKKVASPIKKPLKKASDLRANHYNIPVPNNKFGRILTFRFRIIPRFLVNAFKEIRLVVWPNRQETIKLTLAVFIFAFVFAALIGLVDFGFSKAFEQFIVKK